LGIREDYERGIKLYNAGDLNSYAKEYAKDAVLITPDRTAEGRTAIREYWSRQRAAFPDCTQTVEALVEQGDTIVTEWTWVGTHTGPLVQRDGTELTPTGRRIELKGMELAQMLDGKIHVYHMYWDGMAIAAQLGLLPEHKTTGSSAPAKE
jgi:predicted ester cyclase